MCVCVCTHTLAHTHNENGPWTCQAPNNDREKGGNKRWTNKCRRKRRRQKDLHRQKKWLRRKMNRMENKSNVYVCVCVCVGKKSGKRRVLRISRRDKRVSENLSCKYSVTARWMLNTQYEYGVPKKTTVTLQIFFTFFSRFCFIDTYINLLYFYLNTVLWFLWHRFHVNYYMFWFMLLRQLEMKHHCKCVHTLCIKTRNSFIWMEYSVWRFCFSSTFPEFFPSNENSFIGIAIPSLHVVLKIWLFSTQQLCSG